MENIISSIDELEAHEIYVFHCIVNVLCNRKNCSTNLVFENDAQLITTISNNLQHTDKYPDDIKIILHYLLRCLEISLDCPSDIFEKAVLPGAPIRVVKPLFSNNFTFEKCTKEIINLYKNKSSLPSEEVKQKLYVLNLIYLEFNKTCNGCQCAICSACKLYLNRHMLKGYSAVFNPCCSNEMYCHFCNETSLFQYYYAKF